MSDPTGLHILLFYSFLPLVGPSAYHPFISFIFRTGNVRTFASALAFPLDVFFNTTPSAHVVAYLFFLSPSSFLFHLFFLTPQNTPDSVRLYHTLMVTQHPPSVFHPQFPRTPLNIIPDFPGRIILSFLSIWSCYYFEWVPSTVLESTVLPRIFGSPKASAFFPFLPRRQLSVSRFYLLFL